MHAQLKDGAQPRRLLGATHDNPDRGSHLSWSLEAAVKMDQPQACALLLGAGANPDTRTDEGIPVLHVACREGHRAAVVMLVEAGVMLEAQDRDARTPLHLACMMAGKPQHTRGRDHVLISQYLQQEGAATATQDKFGHTPLSYLPQRAKRIGLMTPAVDGQSAQWAVEVVGKDGTVAAGSVAQSAAVRILG